MQTNVHHPTLAETSVLNRGTSDKFVTLKVTDNVDGGRLVLFIKSDWSDWDKLVAEVDKFRSNNHD